jgi:predicted nucleic-acid-binding protein
MIGLDTNVLLRLATNDDPAQVGVVTRWLAAHAGGEALHVNHVVLAEAVWTLKSAYRADRARIATFVDALLANAEFDLEDAAAVEEALSVYRAGAADFPDCLIAAKNARTCKATITFDKAAAGLPRTTVLGARRTAL